MNPKASLSELALLYARIGATSFGGPQAQIAMQHEEVVDKRQWLSEDDFLAGVALFEVLPGPAATQTGIYIGYTQGGWLGAVLTAFCYVMPAFAIEVVLSWAYFRWQGVGALAAAFLGMAPIVIAILLAFCWKLSQKVLRSPLLTRQQCLAQTAIALITLLLAWRGVNVLILLLAAGVIGIGRSRLLTLALPLPALSFRSMSFLLGAQLPPETLGLAQFWDWPRLQTYIWPLFSFFFKTGSFIFGGGLVIIPFIESEVVETLHWLTPQEFLDGVAIGQLSPGPVVLTAAFIGYKVAGLAGAAVAAFAIFLPSFIFVGLAAPLMQVLREKPVVKDFLQGVLPAVLGVIASATLSLARSAWLQETTLLTLGTIAISVLALVALMRFRVPTWQLVIAGMLAGLGLTALRGL